MREYKRGYAESGIRTYFREGQGETPGAEVLRREPEQNRGAKRRRDLAWDEGQNPPIPMRRGAIHAARQFMAKPIHAVRLPPREWVDKWQKIVV